MTNEVSISFLDVTYRTTPIAKWQGMGPSDCIIIGSKNLDVDPFRALFPVAGAPFRTLWWSKSASPSLLIILGHSTGQKTLRGPRSSSFSWLKIVFGLSCKGTIPATVTLDRRPGVGLSPGVRISAVRALGPLFRAYLCFRHLAQTYWPT